MTLEHGETTRRPCLGGCGRMIESEGTWHRLCRRCNARNSEKLSRREWSGGIRPAVDVPEARDPTAGDLL